MKTGSEDDVLANLLVQNQEKQQELTDLATIPPPPVIKELKAGQTIWALAKEDLGPGATNAEILARAQQYMEVNGITDPRALRAGSQLTVPLGSEQVSLETRQAYNKSDRELQQFYAAKAAAERAAAEAAAIKSILAAGTPIDPITGLPAGPTIANAQALGLLPPDPMNYFAAAGLGTNAAVPYFANNLPAQEGLLRQSVAERAWGISTEGSAEYLSRSQRGPVLSGVMDTRTGEIFYGLNQKGVPTNLHPLLQQSLGEYLAGNGGVTPERAGIPGSHSEVVALDQAIKAREAVTGRAMTQAEFGEFLVSNRTLIGQRRGVGVPPPCANCAAIIEGTTLVEEPPRLAVTTIGNPKLVAGLNYGGKALMVVGVAQDSYSLGTEIYKSTETGNWSNTAREATRISGGWAGAWVGAQGGAVAGAEIGLFGGPLAEFTVPIGAFLGGLIGGGIGYWSGSNAATTVYDSATKH